MNAVASPRLNFCCAGVRGGRDDNRISQPGARQRLQGECSMCWPGQLPSASVHYWATPHPPPLCMHLNSQVYASNACQIIPPADAAIAAAIEAELPLWQLPPVDDVASYSHPLVRDPLPDVADRYYSALKRHLHYRSTEANAAAPAMAYTALHGVGTPWLLRAFSEWGLPRPVLAPLQCEPDPDFSTGNLVCNAPGHMHVLLAMARPRCCMAVHYHHCCSLLPQPGGGQGCMAAGVPGSRVSGSTAGHCQRPRCRPICGGGAGCGNG